jgi:hypothetical protein
MSYFELQEFESSRHAFSEGLKRSPEGHATVSKFRMWIRKCDAEIEDDDGTCSADCLFRSFAVIPGGARMLKSPLVLLTLVSFGPEGA